MYKFIFKVYILNAYKWSILMKTYDDAVEYLKSRVVNIHAAKEFAEMSARFTCMSMGTDDDAYNIREVTEFTILVEEHGVQKVIEYTKEVLDTIETMEKCGRKGSHQGCYLIAFNSWLTGAHIPMFLDWISEHKSSALRAKYKQALADCDSRFVGVISLSYSEARKYLKYCIKQLALYDLIYGVYYHPGYWSLPACKDEALLESIREQIAVVTSDIDFEYTIIGLYGYIGDTKQERRRLERVTKLRMKWWLRRIPKLNVTKRAFTVSGKPFMLIAMPSSIDAWNALFK